MVSRALLSETSEACGSPPSKSSGWTKISFISLNLGFHPLGKLETFEVADPYSSSLAINSEFSQFVVKTILQPAAE